MGDRFSFLNEQTFRPREPAIRDRVSSLVGKILGIPYGE